LVVKLHLGQAEALFFQGSYDECIPRFNEVVRQATSIQDLGQLANAYMMLHLAHTMTGSTERVAFRGLALPIYEELGDLLGQGNTLNNLGIDAYYEGRWDDALELYARSRDARTRIGDVIGAAMAANNIAEILSDQGRYEEAEEMLRDVYTTCDRAGNRLLAAVAEANLGRAAARRGELDAGRALLEQALATLTDIRAGSFVVETRARLAEVALHGGDASGALAQAEAAVADTGAAAAPNVQALLHRIRGYALAALGRDDEARAELEESLGVARESDTLYEVALTLRARARVGGGANDEREAQALLDALHVVRVAEPSA
jgi:tetratricopeptide (TPR) repeat protein